SLKGALLREPLRSNCKPDGLTRLRSNLCPVPSFPPKCDGLLQRPMRFCEFFGGKRTCVCTICQSNRSERLFHISVDRAFGFLDLIQARSIEVVHTFDQGLLNTQAGAGGFILQYDKSTRRADQKVRLRGYENREL